MDKNTLVIAAIGAIGGYMTQRYKTRKKKSALLWGAVAFGAAKVAPQMGIQLPRFVQG